MDDSQRHHEFIRLHTQEPMPNPCHGCGNDLNSAAHSGIKPGYCWSCVEGSGNRAQRRAMAYPKNQGRLDEW